jgi:hypothetical protein
MHRKPDRETRMNAVDLGSMCKCAGKQDKSIKVSAFTFAAALLLTRLSAALLFICSGLPVVAAPNTYSAVGAPATSRFAATTTLLPSGKVLLAGGQDWTLMPVPGLETFDPATGLFSAAGALVTPRVLPTSTLLPTGKVLIAGGYDASFVAIANAELYDPANNASTATGSLLQARENATATLLSDGEVLIAGGSNALGYLASAELFDRGLGFANSERPQVATSPANLVLPGFLGLTGVGFRASTQEPSWAKTGAEGSSGGITNSATSYPMVQLERIDNEQQWMIGSSAAMPWNDVLFLSAPLFSFNPMMHSGLPNSVYRTTLFSNGVPSQTRFVTIKN